jgi:hypothetical protein
MFQCEGVHQGVEGFGGNSGLQMSFHQVQSLDHQLAGAPDSLDIRRGLQPDIGLVRVDPPGKAICLGSTALLEFLAASAGAWVVATDFCAPNGLVHRGWRLSFQ